MVDEVSFVCFCLSVIVLWREFPPLPCTRMRRCMGAADNGMGIKERRGRRTGVACPNQSKHEIERGNPSKGEIQGDPHSQWRSTIKGQQSQHKMEKGRRRKEGCKTPKLEKRGKPPVQERQPRRGKRRESRKRQRDVCDDGMVLYWFLRVNWMFLRYGL